MYPNSFGSRFVVHSFGESHGPALGAVIDGCPAGLEIQMEQIEYNMQRRKPGSSSVVSARSESDQFEILSGIYQNKTLGTPICMIVKNHNAQSEDYKILETQKRIGHADQVWQQKFGHSDLRGGGRSSGRETLSRVLAASVAQQLLQKLFPQLKIIAYSSQIADISLSPSQELELHKKWNDLPNSIEAQKHIDSFATRLPNTEANSKVQSLLEAAKQDGKSYGGCVSVIMQGVPAGLGQAVFHKLKADLASALMGIGATCSFELGEGSNSSLQEGSEFHQDKQKSVYGGIQGGISTGENIYLKLYFKPTSSVLDVAKKGRHDPCIVIRAIPVVEAMCNLVMADHALWQRSDRL